MATIKCPVCEGKGVVPQGFYNTYPYSVSNGTGPEICKRCGGIGTLEVMEHGCYFYPSQTNGL